MRTLSVAASMQGVVQPSTRISGPNPVFVDSELVLALVAPVGTNFGRFQNLLDRGLSAFGYTTNVVRLSELTKNFQTEPVQTESRTSPEAARLHQLMHAGNYLRFNSPKGEFLALAAAKAIRSGRPTDPSEAVLLKTAHIVRSLKHPDEVRALRRIYGPGFFLIGITVEETQRRSFLRDDKGCSTDEVNALLLRDEHEEDPKYVGSDGTNFGQRTRDTFHLADVFIPLDDEGQLERFLRLAFGDPFITPTLDEHAMFLAFSAALRSADLSRQVGAVVVTEEGDVAAVGANDVPRAGGGLYWPGKDDQRDHVRGNDSNEAQRDKIVADVLERLRPRAEPEGDWLARGRELLAGTKLADLGEEALVEALKRLHGNYVELSTWDQESKRQLASSQLMDITEYGRATHAEMEALLSCARSGVSTRGCTLYSTTFPCHNCAKHIIAAGVSRVVYVEPYPKSQARELFDDSITLGPAKDGHVGFEPFVGIGPRRFFDLFSIGLSSGTTVKRKQGGVPIAWAPEKGLVRVPLLPNSYLEREKVAEDELLTLTTQPEEPA